MKVRVNGEEFDAISADVEKGEAMLALLDAEGNQAYQPNGEIDYVIRRGIVEIVETAKKNWNTNKD